MTFYKNSSPSNCLDKSIAPVGSSMTVALKEPTSIIDPDIIVSDPLGVPNTFPANVNYFYIEELGRYYYITDAVSFSANVWEIIGHVDVLMSFKDEIKAQTAILSRQENLRNMYLDDGTFMAYQNPIIVTRYFSATAPFEAQEYVLTIAGS